MNTQDWKLATPQQRNLYRYASGLIAFNSVTPVFYSGLIAGSEFLVYNAGKVYICLDVMFATNASTNPAAYIINTYDMANAVNGALMNNRVYWDTVTPAPKFGGINMNVKNFWFSRIVANNFNYIIFNGYRLNV